MKDRRKIMKPHEPLLFYLYFGQGPMQLFFDETGKSSEVLCKFQCGCFEHRQHPLRKFKTFMCRAHLRMFGFGGKMIALGDRYVRADAMGGAEDEEKKIEVVPFMPRELRRV